MFVGMLEKDSPLHCTVLEEYTKNVRTLLEERCDVSTVDSVAELLCTLLPQLFRYLEI